MIASISLLVKFNYFLKDIYLGFHRQAKPTYEINLLDIQLNSMHAASLCSDPPGALVVIPSKCTDPY